METKTFEVALAEAMKAVDEAMAIAKESDSVSVADHAELCQISVRLFRLALYYDALGRE